MDSLTDGEADLPRSNINAYFKENDLDHEIPPDSHDILSKTRKHDRRWSLSSATRSSSRKISKHDPGRVIYSTASPPSALFPPPNGPSQKSPYPQSQHSFKIHHIFESDLDLGTQPHEASSSQQYPAYPPSDSHTSSQSNSSLSRGALSKRLENQQHLLQRYQLQRYLLQHHLQQQYYDSSPLSYAPPHSGSGPQYNDALSLLRQHYKLCPLPDRRPYSDHSLWCHKTLHLLLKHHKALLPPHRRSDSESNLQYHDALYLLLILLSSYKPRSPPYYTSSHSNPDYQGAIVLLLLYHETPLPPYCRPGAESIFQYHGASSLWEDNALPVLQRRYSLPTLEDLRKEPFCFAPVTSHNLAAMAMPNRNAPPTTGAQLLDEIQQDHLVFSVWNSPSKPAWVEDLVKHSIINVSVPSEVEPASLDFVESINKTKTKFRWVNEGQYFKVMWEPIVKDFLAENPLALELSNASFRTDAVPRQAFLQDDPRTDTYVKAPRPDWACGLDLHNFSSKVRAKIRRENLYADNKLMLPWLCVEAKGSKGRAADAIIQASRDGATMLNVLRRIRDTTAQPGDAEDTRRNVAFTSTFTTEAIHLYVHWTGTITEGENKGEVGYFMSLCDAYLLAKGQDLLKVKAVMEKVMQWGVKDRMNIVEELKIAVGDT